MEEVGGEKDEEEDTGFEEVGEEITTRKIIQLGEGGGDRLTNRQRETENQGERQRYKRHTNAHTLTNASNDYGLSIKSVVFVVFEKVITAL